MFGNVLVGVDGKAGGRDAVALAAKLLDDGGRLTIVHARQGQLNPIHAVTPGLLAEERAASEELLERERSHAGVEAETLSVTAASAGRALHEQAESRRTDLIVVGSCSRGAIGRVMLGDETRAALDGAPCAVAIAAHGLAGNPTIARIGVAYNGSPESRTALAAARALAAERGTGVRALQVLTLPLYGVGFYAIPIADTSDRRLKEATQPLEGLADVQAQAIYGVLPGEELAAFGDGLDLLVVGSRGYGPLKRLVVGSTSGYLERHAHCSLLILPASGTGRDDARSAARSLTA